MPMPKKAFVIESDHKQYKVISISAAYAMPMPKKAFVIESDHNQYKCPHENCGKGFRKESLLDYHIKYYHIEGETPPPPAPAKKRRVTTSMLEF